MVTTPSKQMSFRAEPELASRIARAAAYEELSVADFVRKVFRIGFERYEELGSLHALRSATAPPANKSKRTDSPSSNETKRR
jgi:HicB family